MNDTPKDPAALHETVEEYPPPTGTLFFMMIFLAVLAGMWGAMYLIMLSR